MSSQPLIPGETQAYAKARAEGYSHGVAAARKAAAEQQAVDRAEHEHLLEQLRQTGRQQASQVSNLVQALNDARIPAVQEYSRQLLEAAYTISEAVVGAVLDDDTKRALSVAVRATMTQQAGTLRVLTSPDDAEQVAELLPDTPVRSDSSLAPGDFKAEYPHGWVDGLILSAIERVREETGRHTHAA